MKGKYLITTDQWFFAPDGLQYRCVWGDVEIITDSFLGITTNRNSTNWFAKVGTPLNHVIVAGCQIHYAVSCEEKPNDGGVLDFDLTNCKSYTRPTQIYIAD